MERTKDEILEDIQEVMPFAISEKSINYIKEAMDIWAIKCTKDELKNLSQWIDSKNHNVDELMIQQEINSRI